MHQCSLEKCGRQKSLCLDVKKTERLPRSRLKHPPILHINALLGPPPNKKPQTPAKKSPNASNKNCSSALTAPDPQTDTPSPINLPSLPNPLAITQIPDQPLLTRSHADSIRQSHESCVHALNSSSSVPSMPHMPRLHHRKIKVTVAGDPYIRSEWNPARRAETQNPKES